MRMKEQDKDDDDDDDNSDDIIEMTMRQIKIVHGYTTHYKTLK